MSHINHSGNATKHAIEHNIEFSPESLGTSDESLLGIYCQHCDPPQTPRQERIAERYYLQSLSRELLPTERTAQCLRTIAPHAHEVELHRNSEQNTAHFRNLLTCGRVWFCPVCSAKITERRAQELQQFCTYWTQERGTIALVTTTIQHQHGEPLTNLLSILKDARRKYTSGKPMKKIREDSLFFGSVSATEITHGKNGWHPHQHELMFFEYDLPITRAGLEDRLQTRWKSAVERAGGSTHLNIGLDYKDADTDVYSYIAKYGHPPQTDSWSIDREVTKAISKRAKATSKTPWQLLDDYGNGDTHAGKLFQEYAYAVKGRNQLVWSRALKAEYKDFNPMTDEQIADEHDEHSELFATLTRKQWYEIINLSRDIRGQLLTIAGNGDNNAFFDFLLSHGISLDVEF